MWRIDHPYFFLLLAVPVVGWLFFVQYQAWKMEALKKLGLPSEKQSGADKKSFQIWAAIAILTVLTAVNFRFGRSASEVQSRQAMVMIALDVSTSMLTEDTRPNRINFAKKILTDWVNTAPTQTRIGLMTFAGSAQVETPPILDKSFVLQRLSLVEPEQVMEQGTDVALCLKNATKLLASQEFTPILLLVTDAEDHSEEALVALEKATEQGLAVLPIGIGTVAGGPVPAASANSAYLKDASGNLVRSVRNDDLLKAMADKSSVRQYLVADGTALLTEQIETIRKKFENGSLTVYRIQDYTSRYLFFLIPLIGLLFYRVLRE